MFFINTSFIMFFEAALIASSISLDSFTASFAYGGNKIKIPLKSIVIINLVCCAMLGISLLIGTALREYVPLGLTGFISFGILFFIGAVKLLDSVTKSIIRKYSSINKEIRFSVLNFKFILNLYADPEKADVDASKTISPSEAATLAVALSLDGLAVGFGAALGNVNGLAIFFASLLINLLALMLGCFLGTKAANKSRFNISWLGGVVLIVLAFANLF